MKHKITRNLTLLLLILISYNIEGQNKITVSGKIIDKIKQTCIEYANIGINGKNIGTISNEEGEFELTIPESLSNKELVISYIGYKVWKSKISKIKSVNLNIQLEKDNIEIEEVVISSLSPEELIKKVIKSIPINYTVRPYHAIGFYREIKKENRKSYAINEGVIDFYKTSYQPKSEDDQARVIRGRKVISEKPAVFEGLSITGGPLGGVGFDIVKYPVDFLSKKSSEYYDFEYASSTSYNGKIVYTVDFSPKPKSKKGQYTGRLYIDINSLAVVGCRYKYSKNGLRELRPGIVGRGILKVVGISFYISNTNLNVCYEENNGKWFLKNIYTQGEVVVIQPKKEKKATINYTQNLLITNRKLKNISPIPKDKRLKKGDEIGGQTSKYDKEFWDNYNIIKAGKKVEKAREEMQGIKIGNIE